MSSTTMTTTVATRKPARMSAPAVRAARCAAPPVAAPARLTRRGRLVLVVALLLTAWVATSLGRASVATTTPPAPAHYSTVTVQQGQTLWEIAQQVAPHADPRATIARIVDLNALPSANDIRPGLRLAIPVN